MTRTGKSWKRLLLRWAVLLCGGYVVLCVLMYVFQRRIQYVPDPDPVPRPTNVRFADLREVELRTKDGLKLYAWYWAGTKPVTLIVFHGNAGHREGRLFWMDGLHTRGWGVFLLDYRGYGGSDGSPSEAGFYIDAEAAIDWVERHTAGPIVYMGQSIGSGVAVEMAVRRPPDALIVQAGFSSATDIASSVYPFLPVRAILKDTYDNASKIDALKCPYLHIHGTDDRLVPYELGRKLFDLAPQPKKLVTFDGVGHNDLVSMTGARYYDAVEAFLEEHLAKSRTGN